MPVREGFGTTTALWHKLQYNVRGQLYNIQLGYDPTTTGDYNAYPGGRLTLYYGGSPYSSATNNGNVTAQVSVAGSNQGGGAAAYVQNYSY